MWQVPTDGLGRQRWGGSPVEGRLAEARLIARLCLAVWGIYQVSPRGLAFYSTETEKEV